MLTPIRRVAVTTASVARDRVAPGRGYFKLSIYNSLKTSIATYVASGTPVPFTRLPFGGLMRQKSGSKTSLSRPEITCDRMKLINKRSAIIRKKLVIYSQITYNY
jgi:hypothetical protein